MSEVDRPRTLRFRNEDELISELGRLRKGYRTLKNWTLPQSSWHLTLPIQKHLAPPISPTPTPEQSAKKAGFVEKMLADRKSPPGTQAPPSSVPPEDCEEAAIDRFIEALQTMKAYPHDLVAMGPCGPVSIEEFRQCHMVHAEHHLAFLIPTAKRRELSYATADDAIADVIMLRTGYSQIGNWNLPQISRHLTIALINNAKPATAPATPEQLKMLSAKEKILADGRLPGITIQAPETTIPPADCNDVDIEKFIAALKMMAAYSEETASHRLFGPLSNEEYKRMSLIHCAHHLSHLTPA